MFSSIGSNSYFLLLSLVCKSSMGLFVSWLANAMERPTTVSTLLHSSTMVLAGLIVWVYARNDLLGGSSLLSICVVLCAAVRVFNSCYK